MPLRDRIVQREHLDAARHDRGRIIELHRQLDRLNRLLLFARPFQLFVPSLLTEERCQQLEILDVGCGSGMLGSNLTRWASKRGWHWHVTGVDWSADTLQPGTQAVAGSATQLPFADGSFDVVIASQMTHHMDSPADVIAHFREAWRVARHAILISDVHRHPAVIGLVWLACLAVGASREIRRDGCTSVRRGFRVSEWERIAREAGIPDARVWLYFGSRILLGARKTGS